MTRNEIMKLPPPHLFALGQIRETGHNKPESDDCEKHQKKRIPCHQEEGDQADEEKCADDECCRIERFGARPDDTEYGHSEPGQQHPGNPGKDVSIVSVRQEQSQAVLREKQQDETADQEVAAQIVKTEPGPVHQVPLILAAQAAWPNSPRAASANRQRSGRERPPWPER